MILSSRKQHFFKVSAFHGFAFLMFTKSVIHKIPALEEGRGGLAKSLLARMGEGGDLAVSVYAIIFFSQVRAK